MENVRAKSSRQMWAARSTLVQQATNVELKGLVETHFYIVVIMMYMYIYTYLYILFRSESSVATPRRVLKGGGAGAMGGFKA